MRGLLARVQARLAEPIDTSALAVFRILFGGLLLVNVLQARDMYGYVAHLQFRFVFFDAVPQITPETVTVVWALTAVCALAIAVGFLHRIACLGFLALFGLFFLQEKTVYLNHYYLILLLAFLMLFVDAHALWSLDSRLFPGLRRARGGRPVVPFWQLAILRAQIVIVYFYAGVAKISPDWLRGVPVGLHFREGFAGTPIAPLLEPHAAALALAWGGMLFDLSIGFLLLWRRTRAAAAFVCIAFHLANAWAFDIGVFPWLMIATLALFWPPDWPRRVLARTAALPAPVARPRRVPMRLQAAVLALFFALQLLLPVRHWLHPGDPAWTGEGRRFAWMMKLRRKGVRIRYRVEDPATGRSWTIRHEQELTPRQAGRHARDPDMILQYARHLREVLEDAGTESPRITVDCMARMNGRPFQRMIDPEVDLASVDDPWWRSAPWILPLEGHAVDREDGRAPEPED